MLTFKDPKLEFRNGPDGLNRLKTATDISPDDPYWNQYWELFSSSSEVLTLLDSFTITTVLAQNPQSLITLIQVACAKLDSLITSPGFPLATESSHENSSKGYLAGLSGLVRGEEDGLGLETLNCVRVLSRIVPFLSQDLHDIIFWTTESLEKVEVEGDHFIIDDEEEVTPVKSESAQSTPLAKKLLATVVDLLFVPGFTLDDSLKSEDGTVQYLIWSAGVASPPSSLPPPSIAILSSRLEILRLINILLALPSLTTDPLSFPTEENKWRNALLANAGQAGGVLERKVVLSLLCSLLNTALASSAGSGSSLLEGIGGMREKLGGVVLNPGRKESEGLLINSSLQLLGVLLIEHALPGSAPSVVNNFSHYLSKLHRPADLEFMFNGITSILFSAILAPTMPALPSFSNTQPAGNLNIQETLILLTKLIETNKKFLNFILESDKGGILYRALMGILLNFKDETAQFTSVRLAAFLLQTITAEKGTGARINESSIDSNQGYNAKFGVVGSMGDFFIVSIYTLIFTTRSRLASLYPSLLLVVNNISPYLKALTPLASTRLVQLFLAISTPSFILMEDSNPRLVFYLLETLEHIVRYQLSDNPYLVYYIIRSSERFERLSFFTLAEGVAEIRAKKRRKSIGNSSSTSLSSLGRMTPAHSVPGSPNKNEISGEVEEKEVEGEGDGKEEEKKERGKSEKARGKMRERSNSNLSRSELGEEEEEEEFVGRNGFIPTEAWVASWREHLPLDVLLLLILEFREKVNSFDASSQSPPPKAIAFLSSATLIGLLPPPPLIKSRPFQATVPSNTWSASLVYISIYSGLLEFLRPVEVRLFRVGERGRVNRSGSDILAGLVHLGKKITG